VSFTARMVGLLPGARTSGPDCSALAGGDGAALGTPQHRRRLSCLRGTVPLLLSATRHLLWMRRSLFQPLPRGDSGGDAPLLLPHAIAPRGARSGQVSCRPAERGGALGGEHGDRLPPDRAALRNGL